MREIQNSTRVKIFRRVSYYNIPLILYSQGIRSTFGMFGKMKDERQGVSFPDKFSISVVPTTPFEPTK